MSDEGQNGSRPSGQYAGSAQTSTAKKRLPHGNRAAATGFRNLAHTFKRKEHDNKHAAPKKHGKVFLFFGVILPVVAMLFEMTTHFCAKHFFDPFPSPAHVVLFALIPFSNYLAWLAGRKDLSAYYGSMSLISGMAMGIGCLYALMFLPLTPMSALYSLFFGFGLLGLAPILAIPCTWLSGKTVCSLATSKKTYFDPHQIEHIGHLIVLCMVVAVELPSTLTRINLSLAADPNTAKQGIQWLRSFGSQEVMQRACYERSGRATDILGSLYEAAHPISVDQARTIFYNVTGKPFNSVPIPAGARATMQHAGNVDDIAGVNAKVEDEFDLDADIAGETVSGVARGLSVSDSTLTGKVDPDSAIADLTWAFTFKNVSAIDREARAKILLPPGAVVTKATLTVNGEEKEATIMVREAARAVYRQAIIEHKKDPLLVSMCGLDQLLVQCFPVQPDSTMMVKLTIAAPLTLDEKQSATLLLPTFEERNFQFDVAENVNIESAKSLNLSGTTGSVAPPVSGKNIHLAAKVEPAQLVRFASILKCDRDPKVEVAFATDPFAVNSSAEHRILPQHYPAPGRLIVVVDGSATMQAYKGEIVKGLKALPNSIPATIVLVGDETVKLCENAVRGDTAYTNAMAELEKFEPVGGHDDEQAVIESVHGAIASAVAKNGGSVLWIHAAQPLESQSPAWMKANLRTALSLTRSVNVDGTKRTYLLYTPKSYRQDHPRVPLLYDLQVVAGPDEVLKDIEASRNLIRVSRAGSLSQDMNRLYAAWQAGSDDKPDYQFASGHDASADSFHRDAKSGILAQICAYHRILDNLQSQNPVLVSQAYGLAGQYHLITPVSSAVVTDINITPTPAPPKAFWAEDKLAELSPINALERAEKEAFSKVTSQLNNLSSAATSAGSMQEQDKLAQQGATESAGKDQDFVLGWGAVQPKAETAASPALSTNASAPALKPTIRDYREDRYGTIEHHRLLQKMAEPAGSGGSADESTRYDYNMGGIVNSGPSYPGARAPQLQGATNGTVGPAESFESKKNLDGSNLKNAPWDGAINEEKQLAGEKGKAKEIDAPAAPPSGVPFGATQNGDVFSSGSAPIPGAAHDVFASGANQGDVGQTVEYNTRTQSESPTPTPVAAPTSLSAAVPFGQTEFSAGTEQKISPQLRPKSLRLEGIPERSNHGYLDATPFAEALLIALIGLVFGIVTVVEVKRHRRRGH